MSLIATENLVKSYRRRRVVNGVSINVNPGEIVGLLGPNGAGKTTTFNMVVGIVKPDEGGVKFEQKEISHLAMHQRARLGIEPGGRKRALNRVSNGTTVDSATPKRCFT